jgi:hypothetical protein
MSLYFAFNLPLQVWPTEDGTDARILNYMPRRERCEEMLLSEAIGDVTRAEFFEHAAKCYENMARLMRAAGADPAVHVYYHDEGMADKP